MHNDVLNIRRKHLVYKQNLYNSENFNNVYLYKIFIFKSIYFNWYINF